MAAKQNTDLGPATTTILDFERLLKLAAEHSGDYRSAIPFPHVMLEDFLSEEALELILENFPSPDSQLSWRQLKADTSDGLPAQRGKLDFSTRESKFKGLSNEHRVSMPIRQLFWELNSSTFIRFLEILTGIDGLLPDPHLQGGGIHQVFRGGFLRVHADFNKHPKFDLDRRLNLLLYLNRDWLPEYGGAIELWSKDMQRCERSILPTAGRCLIFSTMSDSYHGHPHPLNCPEDMTRKSIAMYYYTNGRPESELRPRHGTLWQKLPGE
jgi:hypothetical protein